MLGALISPIANLAGTWLEGKVATTKANAEVKVAKAKAEASIKEKLATGEITWEQTMAEASQTSFKDEYLCLILTVPIILVWFGEDARELVREGFIALELMPDWYKYTLGVIVSASFGVRGIQKIFRR
tara:strand:- start:98 stop:481 length:384 start_codon:yes stop_codon:yes gene_type:complete